MSSPVNHTPIFKWLSQISEWNIINGLSNFMVHLHICTGVVDDLIELKHQITKLNDKPVSIIVVVIKSDNKLKEKNEMNI